MQELSERDALHNEILKVIKNSNAEIGLIRAVLGDIDTTIAMALGRMHVNKISDQLKDRLPRK